MQQQSQSGSELEITEPEAGELHKSHLPGHDSSFILLDMTIAVDASDDNEGFEVDYQGALTGDVFGLYFNPTTLCSVN